MALISIYNLVLGLGRGLVNYGLGLGLGLDTYGLGLGGSGLDSITVSLRNTFPKSVVQYWSPDSPCITLFLNTGRIQGYQIPNRPNVQTLHV